MKGEIQATLLEKLADALVAPVPVLTRREIRLPKVPGKALAVIGMRRSGKSCFLWQCLADLLAAGEPRESLVYLNLRDWLLAMLMNSQVRVARRLARVYVNSRGLAAFTLRGFTSRVMALTWPPILQYQFTQRESSAARVGERLPE